MGPYTKRTDESIDRDAKRDAERGVYDPPWGWFPGRERPGTHDRDQYDKSWNYHNDHDD